MKQPPNNTQKLPNNNLKRYIDFLSVQHKLSGLNFFIRLLVLFPILVWRTLKDAGIELLLLAIFWLVLMKMSQGRDLVVSLFEPDGLYGIKRIAFTVLTVISYSFSMWIIPAFLFHIREMRTSGGTPFRDHLFFVHRFLPLMPFWFLTSTFFFNMATGWFLLIGVGEVALLSAIDYIARTYKQGTNAKVLNRAFNSLLIGGLVLVTGYFLRYYREEYGNIKLAFTIGLYMISALLFQLYLYVDREIVREYLKFKLSPTTISKTPHSSPSTLTAVRQYKTPFKRYPINSWTYVAFAGIHLVVLVFLLVWPPQLNLAPESVMLYIFSFYVFVIDLIFYLIQISRKVTLAAITVSCILFILFLTPLWDTNTRHHYMTANEDTTIFKDRLRDDFEQRYLAMRDRIMADNSDSIYPIILVSGQGGGSRAGMWFSQVLINADIATQGKFREHIFSISTVSGSSVGLSTLISFWEKANVTDLNKWSTLPSKVYATNYVGSSIRATLLTDFLKAAIPFPWCGDRNTLLQNEEANATQRAIQAIDNRSSEISLTKRFSDKELILKKDLMHFFYRPNEIGNLVYRNEMPIVMINTCRSSDGKRGIFSTISLNERDFNDAIDINAYLYEDSIRNLEKKTLCASNNHAVSLVQACNTSELFPIISAPAYIDSLGSFVDGGYHENSGLKTTLDIYQLLRQRLAKDTALLKKVQVYIMYVKNGAANKQLYKPVKSETSILQPLVAVVNQPFGGSESYFEARARVVDSFDAKVTFVLAALDPRAVVEMEPEAGAVKDSKKRDVEIEILNDIKTNEKSDTTDLTLEHPLARWLSMVMVNQIKANAVPAYLNQRTQNMISAVLNYHSIPINGLFTKKRGTIRPLIKRK